jgi:hypothetical protein
MVITNVLCPLTVALTSPGNGTSVSNAINLAATASSCATRVEFYCDGTVLMGTAMTAPYSITWDSTTAPNGSHNLAAKAYDATGNSTMSVASTVTVNNGTVAGPWVLGFGSAGGDAGQTVAVDGSGNIVVAGYFQGTVNFGSGTLTSAGGYDLFLAKYSATGACLWATRFGSTGDEFVKSVAVDSSGNIVVAGKFTGSANFGGAAVSSAGGLDMFVAKYSPTGGYLWSKRFGDVYDDCANSVAVDANGNVIVTGYFMGAVDFGGGIIYAAYGGPDTFVAKYSSSGAHLWSKNFVSYADDRGTGVAIDSGGNIWVSGYFLGSQLDLGGGGLVNHGASDGYVGKLSPSGAYLWSTSFGGTGADQANGIALDSNGNAFVLGFFTTSATIAGASLSTAGGWDVFVAKYSASGSPAWAKSFNSPGNYDLPTALATDRSGNVVITGHFTSTINLGGGVLSAPVLGIQSVFAAKYSGTGGYLWSEVCGGASPDDSAGIVTDGSGYITVTGGFQGTVNFGGQSLTSAGTSDAFLIRLAP